MTEEQICNDYIYEFNTKADVCGGCIENNFLLQFFFLLSFVPFTILFSSWVVAKFMYMPYIKKVENQKDIKRSEKEIVIDYEDKYPIKIKGQENELLDTENCCVCESTPEGLVFMKYNKKNECFDWWGDNKNIKYIYLETVSRKYVNVFKCSNLYIDRNEDMERQLKKEEEKRERDKMEKEDKKDEEEDSDEDLFVKLKPNEKIKPKNKEIKASINGNNYKYYGKIADFKILKQEKLEKNNKKKMDFSSWKAMFNNNN